MLYSGSVVDDVACLLIAGASYPRFGEVFHACNFVLVLPTSFTPQHIHYGLVFLAHIST